MASSFEKSLAAPKSKYVEHILVATHAGEAGVAEIFRALTNRLRDSTWTIVFKSLIIVHLMIREGEPEVTLKFLAQNPHRKLAINHFTEVQTQGHNIRTYSEYLLRRAIEYGSTKVDYVRGGEGRLKRLTVEKGLLREAESVQDQIRALLKCQPFDDEPENEITLTAFRLLTMDLLVLFHVMNEGTINILEHYFELSKPDATRALAVYRTFVKQTEAVVQYLSLARSHEHSTRLEIPRIKHAPTSLAASLEEYLADKDFEINRRQYIAEKEAKKNGGKSTNGASKSTDSKSASSNTTSQQPAAAPTKPSANAPLIDLFESLEDNQQTMATQPMMQQYPQQTGFQVPQQTANMGFPQQPQPFPMQNGQGTNPFQLGQQPQAPQLQAQFTVQESPFALQQQPPQQQPQPLQPTPAGTNPFARQPSPQSTLSPQGGLTVHATGSTNPFRQSAFVNQQTGQGWQNAGSQGTLGGINLDQVPTTSVFPRPGQQQQQNFLG
ncbi:hypothetical protein GGP41_010317 [Bipolaris sorokiniana]|uniref:ENTH domain-containing protein n=1 Tax=Cochliobolus sativus TaxID=45130 RepID=A0A8H5ZI27_COCSA|nr:hypothetical protein GGP41_010317 [Bipolaris sorokiniana]